MRDFRFGRSRADIELINQLSSSGERDSLVKYAMRALGIEQTNRRWADARDALCIRNEASLIAGENVGGTVIESAAPEVADSDDDDDDGGDDDGESDRRPRGGRPHGTRNTIPFAVEHFDSLPDSAHINIVALAALIGKSRPTIYRWIDAGILPPPRKLGATKIGATRNYWTAGDVRRALQG